MYKEQNILLNESKIKNNRIKHKSVIKNFNNILDKNKDLQISKSKKIPKYLNIILLICILFALFIFILLAVVNTKRMKRHNITSFNVERITKNNITSQNKIPIAFSLNDNYVYPLTVSLTSILYNSFSNTSYIFYLLLHPDLNKTKLKKILALKEKYHNCKFELIHMGKNFSNYPNYYQKSSALYYRLKLPDLITELDKIIYLDADTIVHKDLTDMYNLDMGIYYYLGIPDHDINHFEFNGKRTFINSGVLLINLKKLREANSSVLYKNFYEHHRILKADEYIMNSVFYDKISFLPFKYGLPDFGEGNHITATPSNYCKEFHNYVNCTESGMETDSKNRVITHNCYEDIKWWMKNYTNLTDIGKQWLFYASKSNVFDEICKKYVQFESQCEILKKENK